MLITDKPKSKDVLKVISNMQEILGSIVNLLGLQSQEIEVLQYRTYKLEGQYDKARNILDVSKNIKEDYKQKLYKELPDANEQSDGLQPEGEAKEDLKEEKEEVNATS